MPPAWGRRLRGLKSCSERRRSVVSGMELGVRWEMGLESVSSRQLEGWVAAHLQPSTEFSTAVKQTVKDICDFLKERCFEGISVLKTVKVPAAPRLPAPRGAGRG